jgi:hypothetical protein
MKKSQKKYCIHKSLHPKSFHVNITLKIQMKTKSLQVGLLLLAVSILCGCSTTYAPPPVVPNMKEIPDFTAGAKIALINAQPLTQLTNISQSGITINVYANLHEWTESLNGALMKTLRKKGVNVAGDAGKTFKVAVTKATLSMAAGGWSTRTTIVCSIEMGDGQTISLGADDTGYKWMNGVEGAERKLVITILNDERVQKYLAAP